MTCYPKIGNSPDNIAGLFGITMRVFIGCLRGEIAILDNKITCAIL